MSFNYKLFLHIEKVFSNDIFYIKEYWLEKIYYLGRYEPRYRFLPEDHQLRIFYQQIELNFDINIYFSNSCFLTSTTNKRGNKRLTKSIASSSSDKFVEIKLKSNGVFPFDGKKSSNNNSPTYIKKTY